MPLLIANDSKTMRPKAEIFVVGHPGSDDFATCCDQLKSHELYRALESELPQLRLQAITIMHLVDTEHNAARQTFLLPAQKLEPVFRCPASLISALHKHSLQTTNRLKISLIGAWRADHIQEIGTGVKDTKIEMGTHACAFSIRSRNLHTSTPIRPNYLG